jgi:hypothetical protein
METAAPAGWRLLDIVELVSREGRCNVGLDGGITVVIGEEL